MKSYNEILSSALISLMSDIDIRSLEPDFTDFIIGKDSDDNIFRGNLDFKFKLKESLQKDGNFDGSFYLHFEEYSMGNGSVNFIKYDYYPNDTDWEASFDIRTKRASNKVLDICKKLVTLVCSNTNNKPSIYNGEQHDN